MARMADFGFQNSNSKRPYIGVSREASRAGGSGGCQSFRRKDSKSLILLGRLFFLRIIMV